MEEYGQRMSHTWTWGDGSGNCLLGSHEDPSSDPQHHIKARLVLGPHRDAHRTLVISRGGSNHIYINELL